MWFLRNVKVERQSWFPEIESSLKNNKEMAEGVVNKEDVQQCIEGL